MKASEMAERIRELENNLQHEREESLKRCPNPMRIPFGCNEIDKAEHDLKSFLLDNVSEIASMLECFSGRTVSVQEVWTNATQQYLDRAYNEGLEAAAKVASAFDTKTGPLPFRSVECTVKAIRALRRKVGE